MGDIYCATCKEPFESYHMRNDALYDTSLSHQTAKRIVESGKNILSFPEAKKALEAEGWKFGGSIMSIIRCPCCKTHEEQYGTPDKAEVADRVMKRTILADLLGDDEDGLQSMLEDLEME